MAGAELPGLAPGTHTPPRCSAGPGPAGRAHGPKTHVHTKRRRPQIPLHHANFFTLIVHKVNIVARRHTKRILYHKTQTQRALPSLPEAPRQKPLWLIAVRPDSIARGGLHIADGAEPSWCGPARRLLANPCIARTSGAPSCALFHSPVPGPGHITRRYSAHVPWRPRFPQLSSLIDDALESRRAHRAHRSGTADSHLPPNRPQITTLGPT